MLTVSGGKFISKIYNSQSLQYYSKLKILSDQKQFLYTDGDGKEGIVWTLKGKRGVCEIDTVSGESNAQ